MKNNEIQKFTYQSFYEIFIYQNLPYDYKFCHAKTMMCCFAHQSTYITFISVGSAHLYHDIYKVCVYSMNYIMLIQYELQYDGTSSVIYYYSIITI